MENAILHTASSEKESVEIDDILASMLEEKESFAAHYLARQGIDRLVLLSYISHGVTVHPESAEEQDAEEHGEEEDADTETVEEPAEPRGKPRSHKPLQAFAVDLTEKARAGASTPSSAGKTSCSRTSRCSAGAEEQPAASGRARRGQDRHRRGPGAAIHGRRVPKALEGDRRSTPWTWGPSWPGTKFRGDFEERLKGDRGALARSRGHPVHRRDPHPGRRRRRPAAGPWTPPTCSSPCWPRAKLRCIGSTTYEDYKQVLRPGPGAGRGDSRRST